METVLRDAVYRLSSIKAGRSSVPNSGHFECVLFSALDGLADLKSMPILNTVTISNRPNMTDAAAVALARFPKLARVEIVACKITDQGAEALAKNPSLTNVVFSGNELTKAVIIAFAGHPSLTELNVISPLINDLGLEAFAKLPKLTYIQLISKDRKYTDDGLQKLRLVRPELKINCNGWL